jgi:predicted nucleic acid-binding protein
MLVFDSSTLILLAKADLLDLFVEDFGGRLAIPPNVRSEVLMGGKAETAQISNIISAEKIKVLKVKDQKLVEKFMDDFNLGRGEAEALALAFQEGAELVATDDKNAIRAAKMLKIDFVTAIAFAVRAFEKQLIEADEAKLKIEKLKSVGRYGKQIIEDALVRIEKGGV